MLFALAGISAVMNWVAVERKAKALEYVAKPATTALLLVAALARTPDDPTQRAWFVAALAFCLAGDIFLMLPHDLFVPGLASFLVGHIAFVAGIISRGLDTNLGVVLVVLLPVIALPVVRAVRRDHPDLFVPVVAYSVVIGAMFAAALLSQSTVGAAGGVMFVTSDRILAHNRFIKPFPHAQLAIMVTYHAALALLVLSLR